MKYDFELSLDEHTSIGKIVKQIKPNSQVLEFGPGNGRMTQYLINEKQCEVSIVEFDKELFDYVMQFAKDGVYGNIEDYHWVERFKGQLYDAIVFADVLEHLTNPEQVLKAVVPFLKPNGQVLITFPNIAHNSVLIDLFNNRLNWNRYGLLDATHHSFFTEQGFMELFRRVGLNVAIEDFTYSQVGQNEIASHYEDLSLRVQHEFKQREFGEVYQYFFALTKAPVANPVILRPENSNFVKTVTLFIETAQGVQPQTYPLNNRTGENRKYSLQLPSDLLNLYIQPLAGDGIVQFKVWVDGKVFRHFESRALWRKDGMYLFSGNEKENFFVLNGHDVAGKTVEIELIYLFDGRFTELEHIVLNDFKRHRLEKMRLEEAQTAFEKEVQARYDFMSARYNQVIQQKAWQRHRKYEQWLESLFFSRSHQKLQERLVQLTIESVEVDAELHTTIIKGWGFSKNDLEPLSYQLRYDEGCFYKVTPLYRKDVNDAFDLPAKQKYGFIMEIEQFEQADCLHLTIQTINGERIPVLVNRHNLSNASLYKRVRYVLGMVRHLGIKGTLKHIKARKENQDQYERWIEENEQFNLEQIQAEIAQFKYQPKISIAVPVYNVEEKWLRVCVDSLKNQFYSNWELCIADDASTQTYIRPLLESMMAEDERIKVVFREENGHISEATNSALGIATGEYIGFMDNDDELAPHALYEVVKALNLDQSIDFIYTDEDKITTRGKRFDPFFKPEWNQTLLMGHNYITHFVVVKRELVLNQVGGLRKEYNGSQDYDFVLRATQAAHKIHHIPKILYHWRTVETSTALDPQTKEYAYIAGKNALIDTLKREGIRGNVTMTKNYGAYKVDYEHGDKVKISLIPLMPELVNANWAKELLEKTNYSNCELVLPANITDFKNARVVLAGGNSLEELVQQASGEYLIFIHPSLLPQESHWLEEMANFMLMPEVGLVTGKIVNKDDFVMNAGVVLDNEQQSLIYEQAGVSNKTLGYYFRIVLPRELYTATEDCLMISKTDYLQLNGFNLALQSQLRGVDLSIRMQQLGKKVIFTPYATLVEQVNISRQIDKKAYGQMAAAYTADLLVDTYQNPNKLV
ncbi:glycosyltransferase [Enterococcus columbae]|uniref:Glycosyltransferase 2-like domain-containing protein n=1 Tax=Enterococcus columbae DSM 7374 = ATCC 51263 TaxID=1121865 RepID=S1P3F5_9ENTE|nr:glycosyltransferase [Enterococcus columbae]EOT42440.1 hypothetical protein OMW_00918 [Enterococcus columbae DSM 7374 = ATCC 51263]EOW87624.1 hypothetical protein I568_00289 [Enterococcus columbae DSM 7374 = ATCC 51263]OJG22157.1 hypothetical protein RR47_GL001069 [Enterococcus columbae DSM 7374 = ATCC 51263]